MKSTPLVSILINNYNYGRFLGAAIESALGQTYSNIEVVVVDDGSTDQSRDVIAAFGQGIVPVLKQNGGQASAFNAGFAASRGEIICFLDSDDMFAPGKVAAIVDIFDQNPGFGWCFESLWEFNDGTGYRGDPAPLPAPVRWDARVCIGGGKAPHIPTATSGMSYRRNTLACILPMPEVIRITSDGYVKLVGLSLAEGCLVSAGLTFQRIHANNAYTNQSAGRMRVAGRTGLLTGVCLFERFPALQDLAVTMFARGLGTCWTSGGLDCECRQVAKAFLTRLSLPTRAAVCLRAVYSGAYNLMIARSFNAAKSAGVL